MAFIDFTRKSALYTNIVYTCISTTVQFFYLFLLLLSPWNIIVPSLTTLGTLIVSCVNFFNTTIEKNGNDSSTPIEKKENDVPTPSQEFKVKLFLSIIIPCMVLNAGAAFIGAFQGIILLIGALSFSITPLALGIAICVGIISLFATTLYNIVQSHEIINKRILAQPKQAEQKQANVQNSDQNTASSQAAATSSKSQAVVNNIRELSNETQNLFAGVRTNNSASPLNQNNRLTTDQPSVSKLHA